MLLRTADAWGVRVAFVGNRNGFVGVVYGVSKKIYFFGQWFDRWSGIRIDEFFPFSGVLVDLNSDGIR